MATWSFRRSIKIIPGIRLNFSRNGVSTTIGVRGAHLTFTKDGTYMSAGVPGTGLYTRQKISTKTSDNPPLEPASISNNRANDIFSVEPEHITSQDMQGIKESIIAAHTQRKELTTDIRRVKREVLFSWAKLVAVYIGIIGLVKKEIVLRILDTIQKQKDAIKELENQRDESYVKLDIEFDSEIKAKYEEVVAAFTLLAGSQKIWDITRAEEQNRIVTRSAASRSLTRRNVFLGFKDLEDIKFDRQALYFNNANGADLYLYPNFLVMKSVNNFGVIGFDELSFEHSDVRFVETQKIPSDSTVIDYTWQKVNKDGNPDRRFKDNHRIPIVRYGAITMKTNTGVNEEYQFSNYEACERFGRNFNEFRQLVSKTAQPNTYS